MHDPFGYWYATRRRDARQDAIVSDEGVSRVSGGGRLVTALAVVATIALIAFVVLLALFVETSSAVSHIVSQQDCQTGATSSLHTVRVQACLPG